MADRGLRARALLDRRFALLVGVFVLLAVAGGAMAYAPYVDPGTTTEDRVVSSWRLTTNYDHSATVQRDNTLFPRGTELRNRDTYFTRLSPRLNGTQVVSYAADEAADVTVRTNATLVIRSVTDRGAVLWRVREELGTTTSHDVAPDQPVRTAFAIDVRRIRNRTRAIREDIGGAPGSVDIVVRTTVRLRGTVNGDRTVHTATDHLNVSTAGGIYRVTDDAETETPVVRRAAVTVSREYGALNRVGGPLLFLTSSTVVAGLLLARRRNRIALTPTERERVTYLDDRREYDDWITRLRLPDAAVATPRGEADRLADLVDLAIDTNTTVIEDPDSGDYYVLQDDYYCAFSPPELDAPDS